MLQWHLFLDHIIIDHLYKQQSKHNEHYFLDPLAAAFDGEFCAEIFTKKA